MSNLKILRKRIHSIKSTQKITRAMMLVASNKLKKAQDSFHNSFKISKEVGCITKQLVSDPKFAQNEIIKNLYNNDQSKLPKLVILITSDKGLCGSYNSSIIKKLKRAFDEDDDYKLIVIGKKGKEAIKSDKIIKYYSNDSKEYIFLTENLSEFLVTEILNYQSCFFYYNSFKGLSTHISESQKVWPIDIENEIYNYEFEDVRIEDVLKLYFQSSIFNLLLSSNASEFSSRMIAMDSATRNAKSIVNKLTLQLNRNRQAFITKELTEIISGAEVI